MPFTLAHPAAIIPLRRALGRHSVPSAMVIGSMSPDLHNFLPVDIGRADTHSIAGTVFFCLPLGMLLYLLFQLLFRQPLLSLLSERVASRFNANAPLAPPPAVLLSLLLGILTHFLWDTFAHGDALGVALVPMLDTHLVTVKGYPIYLYKLVQHGSAVIGLLLMGWWTMRWLRQAPAHPAPERFAVSSDKPLLSSGQRIAAVGATMLLAAIAGVTAAADVITPPFDMYALRDFVRAGIITAMSTIAAAGFIYSVTWHIVHLRRN